MGYLYSLASPGPRPHQARSDVVFVMAERKGLLLYYLELFVWLQDYCRLTAIEKRSINVEFPETYGLELVVSYGTHRVPGEIKRRGGGSWTLSPEEIMSREVELGCESWTSFDSGCSSTALQRTLSL